MKQQCPNCKRWMKLDSMAEENDEFLLRARAKFPNAQVSNWSCSNCEEEFTVTQTTVVLFEN